MPFIGGQPLPRRLFSCPALGTKCRCGPRTVSLCHERRFTSRWVTLSRFCASLEGADLARGGLGPRIIACAWVPVRGQTVATIFDSRETGRGEWSGETTRGLTSVGWNSRDRRRLGRVDLGLNFRRVAGRLMRLAAPAEFHDRLTGDKLNEV